MHPGCSRATLRKRRLELVHPAPDREHSLRTLLEDEIWPSLPRAKLGHAPTQEEQDAILGYDEPTWSSTRRRSSHCAGEPLLCKGHDFALTDLVLA